MGAYHISATTGLSERPLNPYECSSSCIALPPHVDQFRRGRVSLLMIGLPVTHVFPGHLELAACVNTTRCIPAAYLERSMKAVLHAILGYRQDCAEREQANLRRAVLASKQCLADPR